MKRIAFSILVCISSVLTSCSEDDGETQDPIPMNSKPVITVVSPEAIQSSGNSNQVLLHVKYKDNVELLSTTITLTASALSGAPYFAETRALNGTSAEVRVEVDLQEISLLGSHLLTISANNDLGNQEFSSFDFELVDLINPQLDVTEFYSDLPGNPGTPHSKFTLTSSDNYALEKVTREIYKTTAAGIEIERIYDSEETFSTFKKTYSYDREFQINWGVAAPGDYYIGKVTVVDLAGNETQFKSDVKRFF